MELTCCPVCDFLFPYACFHLSLPQIYIFAFIVLCKHWFLFLPVFIPVMEKYSFYTWGYTRCWHMALHGYDCCQEWTDLENNNWHAKCTSSLALSIIRICLGIYFPIRHSFSDWNQSLGTFSLERQSDCCLCDSDSGLVSLWCWGNKHVFHLFVISTNLGTSIIHFFLFYSKNTLKKFHSGNCCCAHDITTLAEWLKQQKVLQESKLSPVKKLLWMKKK